MANEMTREQEILAKYSSPGLRRNELTPAAKREQLLTLGVKDEAEITKILAQLYPDQNR